jgi:putative two-component system response regulator
MSEMARILFVDDEPNFLDGLRRMLYCQRTKWVTSFVHSADEALEEIRRNGPDVVVTDARMPGKDGLELLTTLRGVDKTKDVPVIVLTGAAESDLKRHALDLGAADLLNKPVNLEDLLARINNALRVKSYQDELKASNESLEQKVADRTAELEESRRDIIWRLAKAGEYRDEETGNHIARVGCYCRVISEGSNLPNDFVETIFLTSPLHDIGKIDVPDRILLKEGKLTPEERKTMERHCAIGADILLRKPKGMRPFLAWRANEQCVTQELGDNGILKMAASIAMTHHERWDGGGYPQGLAGEDIPLESRIVALSDVYDALSFARPYKPAYPEDKVLAIMREEAGSHFDPTVYATFERVVDEFRTIREQFAEEMCAEPTEKGIS